MENYIPGVYVQLNHGKRESRDTVDIFFHLLPVTGFFSLSRFTGRNLIIYYLPRKIISHLKNIFQEA